MKHIAAQKMLSRGRARGVSLLTAVFLLVVLATLSAAIVGVFTTQQSGAALDVLGVRAHQAARSGLEWGLYRQLRVQPGATDPLACFTATPVTFAMPTNGGLGAFSVTVACSLGASANVAGNSTNRWTITAVACNKPGASGCPNANPDAYYVQRRVEAQLN